MDVMIVLEEGNSVAEALTRLQDRLNELLAEYEFINSTTLFVEDKFGYNEPTPSKVYYAFQMIRRI